MTGLHAPGWETATETAGGIDPTMKNPRADVPATLDDADAENNVVPTAPSAPTAGVPSGKSRQAAGDLTGAPLVREAIGNWPDPM